MTTTDKRTLLARAGLADLALQGEIRATRFAPVERNHVTHPAAALTAMPQSGAERLTEVLFGEAFDVLFTEGAFSFGQCGRDGYVGFVASDALSPERPAPSHRVCALRTYAFAAPSIKAEALGPYSRNALVAVETREGRFLKAQGGPWFVTEHLAPIGQFASDPAAEALDYLNAPYLWGGVTSLGLDCSGLVQQALRACGRHAPRDSDQQRHGLGRSIDPEDGLKRNDLVFWPGHVGLLLDPETLIHANAHHMAVRAEPLADAIARIRTATGSDPIAWRRLS